MFKSAKTKNVIAATSKPNVLPMLEDLQKRFVVRVSLRGFYISILKINAHC